MTAEGVLLIVASVGLLGVYCWGEMWRGRCNDRDVILRHLPGGLRDERWVNVGDGRALRPNGWLGRDFTPPRPAWIDEPDPPEAATWPRADLAPLLIAGMSLAMNTTPLELFGTFEDPTPSTRTPAITEPWPAPTVAPWWVAATPDDTGAMLLALTCAEAFGPVTP